MTHNQKNIGRSSIKSLLGDYFNKTPLDKYTAEQKCGRNNEHELMNALVM